MRGWALVWLWPLGVLGSVVLVSIFAPFGYLLAIVWGFVLFPYGAYYIWRRSRGPDGRVDENGFDAADTHYWRTTDWLR